LLLHALFLPWASHLNPAICCQYLKQLLPLPDGICIAARGASATISKSFYRSATIHIFTI
jgi:hypothetical protein